MAGIMSFVLGLLLSFVGVNLSTIEQALVPLYHNEGGYSNNPNDSGGETYRGISRNNWPHWNGWQYVDQAKPLRDEEIIHNQNLDNEVKGFYQKYFWDANQLSKINSQEVATKVLDMCVNMGSHRAIELLQQALEVCQIHVNEDGVMGPVTYNAVNQCDSGKLHQALRDVSKEFYLNLVHEHPHDREFLNDWLKRAAQ